MTPPAALLLASHSDTTLLREVGRWLVKGLDESEVDTLIALSRAVVLEPGRCLVVEGKVHGTILILLEGHADVVRDVEGVEVELNTVGPGAVLGEMSFFDDSAAGATVRARSQVRALMFGRRDLSRERLGPTLDVLRANIGERVIERQRQLTERFVATARDKLAIEADRREFGVFFSVMVVLLGVFQTLAAFVAQGTFTVGTMEFSWVGLLAFAIPLSYLGWFAWRSGRPLSDFGLTWVGWQRSLSESLLIALPMIALAILGKWMFRAGGWLEGDLMDGPFFTTKTLFEDALLFSGFAGVVVSRMQGFLHHSLQELLMRGVIQGALTRLYGSTWGAIVASSALFAVGHLFISVPFAVMSFVGGLFFGAVYARHRTLVGVCVLHFLLHTTIKLMGFV